MKTFLQADQAEMEEKIHDATQLYCSQPSELSAPEITHNLQIETTFLQIDTNSERLTIQSFTTVCNKA